MTQIAVIFFDFRTRFFAQIIENRETRLSTPFLGPRDIFFRKVMTKTYLYCSCMAPEICASDPRARTHTSTKSGFRHNFPKENIPRT